jgi:hypothetical protein
MIKIKIQKLTAENYLRQELYIDAISCEKDCLLSPLINDETTFRIKITELSEDRVQK